MTPLPKPLAGSDMAKEPIVERRSYPRSRNRWACSFYTAVTVLLGLGALLLMAQSFLTRQLDTKGCDMSYMRPAYVRFTDFDTEHTRFASKYALYLYREGGIDDDARVKGVPVLFIPGNAGSYKQVRSYAAEAAYHYYNTYQHAAGSDVARKRSFDFFSVDFNEDITAFHGQTLLDQAEYLNDAISFILSLYHGPSRSLRDSHLPDPTSVIILGHSMGGVVARTMLTMPNFQTNSINTIVTLAAPHARPPVSFDGDIVRTYKGVNNYWRQAYLQKSNADNPLRDVTLISIAGGGLDTIVSSDYASVSSLVPTTHGFTVFTSSIPQVWTGMDHLAITWCDQARKRVVHGLYDVVDVSRPSQTVPHELRLSLFKRWLLTGFEDIAEKSLSQQEFKTLLTLAETNSILPQGERLVLRGLGQSTQKPRAYLLPIPDQSGEKQRLTIISSERLDGSAENVKVEILLCSTFPLRAGQSAALFQMNMDLSGDSSGATRLACKNAAPDAIILPASTQHSAYPFGRDQAPFYYVQYSVEDLSEHQFVAVVDKANHHTNGWVVAQFSDTSESLYRVDTTLRQFLVNGLSLKVASQGSFVADVRVPALHSTLFAYTVHVERGACEMDQLFAPLLRQYVAGTHESKYFVNVKDAEINLHGVAPYIPPAIFTKPFTDGLSLQMWFDPTCNSDIEIRLKFDVLGSLGKLWMRYRIVFAVFPLLIVSVVLHHQLGVYNKTGVFMSFADALSHCVKTSLPFTFAALILLYLFLGTRRASPHFTDDWLLHGPPSDVTETLDNTTHELLLGTTDPFVWFLLPLFGVMCIAICAVVNYAILGIITLLSLLYSIFTAGGSRTEETRLVESKGTSTTFPTTSPTHRVITTCVLLSLVSTVIPYHLAYVVLCLVHMATCVRGLRNSDYNFFNYAHSILMLLLWLLPINLPVLVVWVRNLTIHWLTPFSAHHNFLSITPIMILVEVLSTGRVVSRAQSHTRRLLSSTLILLIGAYAAVYGVSYAYVLHHLVNVLCAWLAWMHLDERG